MKISVIIPYVSEIQYLQDCLDSLLTQKTSMEVCIVGRQTPELQEILQRYAGQLQICMVDTGELVSTGAARNAGVRRTSGEYIYFIDCDDYLYGQALDILAQQMEKHPVHALCGRMVPTWYKRSYTLENPPAQLRGDTEEEQPEGGEAENERPENGNAVDKNQKPLPSSLMEREKEGKLADISALHILVSRACIEANGLQFDEETRYCGDWRFVAGLLGACEEIAFLEDAVYFKRKHNDPIHLPSLTQEKNDGRFEDITAAYERLVKPDMPEAVEAMIAGKFLDWYLTEVLPMLYKEGGDWQGQRFGTMQALAAGMPEAVFRTYRGIDKRAIKKLRAGDVTGSTKMAKRSLVRKNLRAMWKKKKERLSFMHRNVFSRLPLKEDVIVFESFFGRSYSDNPKYIYEYIQRQYPGKYKCVWSVKGRFDVPYGAKKVRRMSLAYAYYMSVAKYFVFNVRQPVWFVKRPGMRFMETWHGTPLKKLFFDIDEIYSASPGVKERVYIQGRDWDYFISPNAFSTRAFTSSFMYEKPFLECGYPRNDILYAPDKEELAKGLREKLGIPADKKTILYAPTWRDDEFYGAGEYKFELKLDMQKMKAALGEEYVILLRTHYYIADRLELTGMEGFAYNVSSYEDVSELYLISDVCITDYSSVFFDYANLRRPILFYTYDFEKYKNVLRGFYLDMEKDLPGPLLYDTDAVIERLNNLEETVAEYAERYERFYHAYCEWDDGNASATAAETLLSE